MKTVWLLYVLLGWNDSASEPRLETFEFPTEEKCMIEQARIQSELYEVYEDAVQILQLFCQPHSEVIDED